MNVEIMVCSYARDRKWLDYCLRSIKKFCTGFSGVTLVIPEQDASSFLVLPDPGLRRTVGTYPLKDRDKGHIAMQLQKMRADTWCLDADYILHTDSDCVFTEPVTPGEYFMGNAIYPMKLKPVMLIEEYSHLEGNGAYQWKKVTEDALGFPVSHETMRRHPQVNPRGIYGDLRAHIENQHGMQFDDFILSRKAEFPWGVTEHNFIGAYAMNSPWKDAYYWIDAAHESRPIDKLVQWWSHSPPEAEQEMPSTGERGVPMDLFKKLGLV